MVYSIVSLIGAFCLGYIFSDFVRKVLSKINDDVIVKKVNLVYSELLNNVYEGKTTFVNRINDTISIDTILDKEGSVTIIYMMDKKDIVIFKNDKCIYTSELVDSDKLDELITIIDIFHKTDINDTVNMMGLIFSKNEFERKFNLKIEDLKKGTYIPMEDNNINNEVNFDIDYILDRITEVGIDNLTVDEKTFLDKYKQ